MNKIKEQEHFSVYEIKQHLDQTMCDYNSINIVMDKLSKLRKKLGHKMYILSLNKGTHEPKSYHYKSKAVDVYIKDITKNDVQLIVIDAVLCGFKGIGVYKNSMSVYSFHFDIGDVLCMWRGTKKEGEYSWTYDKLIKL